MTLSQMNSALMSLDKLDEAFAFSYVPWSPAVFILVPIFLSTLLSWILLVNDTDCLSCEEFANYGRRKTEATNNLSKEHLEAIARRRWKTILSWIAFHPDQVATLRDSKGQTILHHAALFRAPAHIMESILWAAPELASIPNRDGEVALHWAVRLSTPNPVLNLLLQANPETAFSRDRESVTPLSLLWERHQTALINTWRSDREQLLTESEKTWKRILFIFRAIHDGRNDKDQSDPFLPLHIAASRPLPPGLLPLMIEVYKEELVARDGNGMLPLAVACRCPVANRYCDVLTKIQLLLREFPDSAKSRTARGRHPLHEALISGVLWHDGIESLIQAYPPALTIADPVSRLFPFALAASEKHVTKCKTKRALADRNKDTVTTIYSLLREDPSVLRIG